MKTKLHSTQNTLGAAVRQTMVELLNHHLADAIDLGLQAKQAHWNVKGPNFRALHELFDEVFERLEEFTDELAERIVELGGVAQGTVQWVAKGTRLKAYPIEIQSGTSHVSALSEALATFGGTARSAIDSAAGGGDAATADLFTEVSRGMDKLLWMIEAHLLEGD